MADFQRIKVNAPEEDDIVIQAGIVTPDDPVGAEVASPSEPEVAVQDDPVEAGLRPTREPEAKPEGDTFRETTLDDLKGSGMGTMQKAIIVVAVVAIVAFVIWYVLLR